LSLPFALEIAGIRFAVEPPPGLRVVMDSPLYAPFLQEHAPHPARVDVPVELTLDEGPDTSRLALAFESGAPWRAYRDGKDLLLDFRDEEGRRVWLTRLATAAPRVRIHCGPFIERVGRDDQGWLQSPLYYPLDQLLTMCLLPHHGGVIVHAAGLRRGPSAAVFPGHSGAGKSTLMSLVSGCEELAGLSDDRVAIREIDGVFHAFGTPWAGTGRVASRQDAELRAVAFVHQSPQTRLERIGPRAALGQLLRTASIPWFDGAGTDRALAVCERLLARVPTYELHFRRHEEVREAVRGLLMEQARGSVY
jgi:hypothetical protein